MKRLSLALLSLVLAIVFWSALRSRLRTIPPPGQKLLERSERVRILRDEWGVPHIFGETDADTAFGLAYANAEDDFPTIQLSLAAAAGKLSLLKLSRDAVKNDYLARLLGIREELAREYDTQLSPEVRKVLDGYADGLNLYVSLHSREADARLYPYTGRDIAAGFLHKLPLFEGLATKLRHVLERRETAPPPPGSNAFAVSRARTPDDVTRLFINSHQPWEGPVAWYEAQLVSEEGWNMSGGTFPGAPMILHGHNDSLGWAHTVNHPPLVDLYSLELDPKHPDRYRYDGEWRELERGDADIEVDLGPFDWTLHRDTYRDVHGPVLKTEQGTFAIRYAGMGRMLRAIEQWYRMNKAHDFGEWKAAMQIAGLPMFNTVYADRRHVFYVYNALLPMREERPAVEVLPGNQSRFLWKEYLPYEKLPMVQDPPSGFVLSANSSPFSATKGEGNPMASELYRLLGVETGMTNRAFRLLDLLGAGEIDHETFLGIKFDRVYDDASPTYHDVIAALLTGPPPKEPALRDALVLLKGWDRVASATSRGAALAVMTIAPAVAARDEGEKAPPPEESLKKAVAFLQKHYGRLDVPLGEVQRLRRGKEDLPLAGGPDVLNAVYSTAQGAKWVGKAGDSLVMDVELGPDKTESWAISPYGTSNRPGSRHYGDQAKYFVRGELRRHWRTEKEIRAHLEREYHPGEELKHAVR